MLSPRWRTIGDVTTILLVEDDERISEPLLRVLGTEGFEVVHAPTGSEGLERSRRVTPT